MQEQEDSPLRVGSGPVQAPPTDPSCPGLPAEPAAAPVETLARERLAPGVFLPWLREGARTALLMRPRWHGLQPQPAVVLGLVLGTLVLTLMLERLWVVGPARFEWQALLAGWLSLCAAAWLCWALLPRAGSGGEGRAPSGAHLLGLLLAQGFFLSSLNALLWGGLLQGTDGDPGLSRSVFQALWFGFWGWLGLAQALLLWRSTPRRVPALGAALLLLGLALLETPSGTRMPWVAAPVREGADEGPPPLELTQELMERQPRLLEQRLQELKPQRPGVVDLYVMTFAPYAHEDVFRRESEMVSAVMQQRFDAAGRSLQLLNHAGTLEQWPWATPLNLRRALQHVGRLMDRDEDVLFIHLTSHGARDGQLAADFWPMSVADLTPQQLKAWLDEAGIRYRVLSISACYSGSWVQPLAGDGTLVMTAADAQHTSYGCGRRSELTFFGRAMYDEQLRSRTLSFEQAHAAARPVIEQREREAGKDDGYSNPQIQAGAAIRARLTRLQARLEGR